MTALSQQRRLTSDLHGGFGTTLTHGLWSSTSGRPVYLPPARRVTSNATNA